MDGFAFLVFCLAVGYVLFWCIRTERVLGGRCDWGWIAMKVINAEASDPIEGAKGVYRRSKHTSDGKPSGGG